MLCPICSGDLEMRKVAPCYDCGHDPNELREFINGEHEYNLYKIYGQELVLCDFCDADFDSYYPDHLGLPEETANNNPLEHIYKLKSPRLNEDGYCKKCDARLAFLVFLKNIREKNDF